MLQSLQRTRVRLLNTVKCGSLRWCQSAGDAKPDSSDKKAARRANPVRRAWSSQDAAETGQYRADVEEDVINEVSSTDQQRTLIKRALAFNNASQPEINRVAVKKAQQSFERHSQDTGSSEVQVAILTSKIEYMHEHMKREPKDFHSLRGLKTMVQKRRDQLKYLKRKNLARYKELINKLDFRDSVRAY